MALTVSQQNAVNTVDHNLQMVACAGSGKTTTIVARILNLLRQPDVEPKNIVAVTYSEKAAAALKQKIYKEYEFINNNSHGIIDLVLEYDSKVVVVDYKTKNIIDDAYSKQLKGYGDYLYQKLHKPVELYLYSIMDTNLRRIDDGLLTISE